MTTVESSRDLGQTSQENFDVADYLTPLLLATWTLALNLPGLHLLEFFRHTEADRTLIAWEMLSSGDFLVPHLLGSEILTKPPLFYWLIASSAWFFSSFEEWVPRVPSVAMSVLFVVFHFLLLRRVGWDRSLAVLSAVCLSTSLMFFNLATVAEIDMTYGFLSAVALYGSYISINDQKLSSTLGAYFFLALAFLTKGPPTLVFFGLSYVAFFAWRYRELRRAGSATREMSDRLFRYNLCGVLVFAGVVGLWLVALAGQVGWDPLSEVFRQEIMDRALQPGRQLRGPAFYLGSLLAGLAPWSIFLVAALAVLLFERSERLVPTLDTPDGRRFLVFNILVVFLAVAVLSLAGGKAARYLFPVHAFAINLAVLAIFRLRDTVTETWMLRLGLVLAIIITMSGIAAPLLFTVDGVTRLGFTVGVWTIVIPIIVLGVACAQRKRALALASLCLIICSLRIGLGQIYIPHRNHTRSVKDVAWQVDAVLPQRTPIYTVEMFERWIVYYLKRRGREIERLTPELARASVTAGDERAYLLLNAEEEHWRIGQLAIYDESLQVVSKLSSAKNDFLLIDVHRDALRYLEPHPHFPTRPSPPYYAEIDMGK